MSDLVQNPSAAPPAISEPLTWAEICARYPDQWGCLVEIDSVNDQDCDFRTARVCGHGKTRDEPLAQAEALWPIYEEVGHFFTREMRAPFPAFVGAAVARSRA